MSKQRANESVGSYITGFVLSVICTLIPYSLVVNKTVTGNSLLAVIVGFATLQVLIQVFFFLHLGRGPKPLYNIAFFAATVGIIMVVVGGSLFIMNNLHYNMLPPSDTAKQLAEGEGIAQVEGIKTGACEAIKANHQIIIAKNMEPLRPTKTQAQLCDTLSFVNQDSMTHEIGFGMSDKPETYAGQSMISIRKGKAETITLNQTGTYRLFDHHNPELYITLTVTQ
jgi:cytochrome o ubiquinol oxidase operon protein cyoD